MEECKCVLFHLNKEITNTTLISGCPFFVYLNKNNIVSLKITPLWSLELEDEGKSRLKAKLLEGKSRLKAQAI